MNNAAMTGGAFTANLGAGDLIMIIQMQGASINTTAASKDFGQVTSYGNAGNYEFREVRSVVGNTINLACALTNSYTAAGKVQVVRVPRYTTLTVATGSTITAPAWDGTTGGIVTLEATGNITLTTTANINVSGLGFRGGAVIATGVDGNSATATLGTNQNYAFTAYGTTAGAEKGESIAGYQAGIPGGFRYGRGAVANGGGGGNQHNGGGGGGANVGTGTWTGFGNPVAGFNAAWHLDAELEGVNTTSNTNAELATSSGGGRGGYTYSSSDQNAATVAPGNTLWGGNYRRIQGGLGGRPLDVSGGRLFLGGGGGAGDSNNGNGKSGAPGGGLVYLLVGGNISDTGTSSTSVVADGAAGTNTTDGGQDGAGGGGGGGTIVVAVTGTLTGVSASAQGGTGGSQLLARAQLNESEGPGGGGGGGYIRYTSGKTISPLSVAGGANGTTNSSLVTEFPPNGATIGGAGTTATFTPSESCLVVADVTTAFTVSSAAVLAGAQTGSYTVTFTNTGTAAATQVTRVITLPTGATATAAQAPGATIGTNTSGDVTLTYTTVASQAANTNTSVTFSFTAPSLSGSYLVTSTTSTTSNQGVNTSLDQVTTALTVTNTAPVANNVTTTPSVNRDAPGQVAILPLDADDSDGSIATYQFTSLPSNGILYYNNNVDGTSGTYTAIGNNNILTGANPLNLTPAQAGSLRFDPAGTSTTSRTFMYTATDNLGLRDLSPAIYTIPVVADIEAVYSTPNVFNRDALGNGSSLATVTDANGAITSATLATGTTLAAGIGFNTTTGQFTVNSATPPAAGTYTYSVNTVDATGGTSTINAVITINADTEAVYTVAPAKNVDSYTNGFSLATVTDANGAITSAVLATGTLPAGIALDATTGQFTVSNASQLVAGTYTRSVTTTDATGGTTTQNVTITINADIEAVYSTPNTFAYNTVTTNQTVATVSDANGALTSATLATGTLPTWLTLNATTGAITVNNAASVVAGTYTATINTVDNKGGLTAAPVSITFTNAAPVAVNDAATTGNDVTTPFFSVTANDTDVDGNATINQASVDLDPSSAGTRETTRTVTGGVFTADNLGNVSFNPDANFFGTASVTYTIKDALGLTSNAATISVTVGAPACAEPSYFDNTTASTGLTAEYYAGAFYTQAGFNANAITFFQRTAPVRRIDQTVDFTTATFGNIVPPATGTTANPNAFSARYRGSINIPVTGSYTFYLTSDDASYLFLDAAALAQTPNATNATINNGGGHASALVQTTVTLTAGKHDILILYAEDGGGNNLNFEWSSTAAGIARQVVPAAALCAGPATPNATPVALDRSTSLLNSAATAALSPNLGATDADGDATVSYFNIETLPAAAAGVLAYNGTAVVVGQAIPAASLNLLTFDPVNTYSGTASFTYSATDATGRKDLTPATYTIIISSAPVAVNDAATTGNDVTTPFFSVTANDTDVDGNATINQASVDLDPSSAGTRETTRTVTGGVFTADNLGNVSFNPDANFFGTASVTYTIKDNDGNVSNVATISVTVDAPACAEPSYFNNTTASTGLTAEYYAGAFYLQAGFNANAITFFQRTAPVRRIDQTVDFSGSGFGDINPAATSTTNPETFSARYRGSINIPVTGSYTFYLTSDDASYLFLDAAALAQTPNATNATINNGGSHGSTLVQTTVTLTAGKHDILILYADNLVDNILKFEWSSTTAGIARQVVPAAALCAGPASPNATPVALDRTTTLLNSAATAALSPNLGATDADGDATVSYFNIETLPAAAAGVLAYNGTAVVAGQAIPAASLNLLTFDPVNTYSGTTSFTYSVTDDTGRKDLTPATYTISIEAPSTISGVVFEDVTYGGGNGRSLLASGGVVRSGATVELYYANGDPVIDAASGTIQKATTNASGAYSFSGLLGTAYKVRVVNSSVSSSRVGYVNTLIGVQTFVNGDGTQVGGTTPAGVDGLPNTGTQTLNQVGVAQSIAAVSVSNGQVLSSVDFGFNFDAVVNTNNTGQGSLSQFITNSNALQNTASFQQVGQTAGKEAAIFHIPASALTTTTVGNQAFIINLTSALPNISGANAVGTVLNGAVQTAYTGNTNAAVAGVTTGPEIILNVTAGNYDILRINAAGVSIEGLGFTGARASTANLGTAGNTNGTGIYITSNGDQASIRNSDIYGNLKAGILVNSATGVQVTDNVVRNNGGTINGVTNTNGQGIDVFGADLTVVSNNTVTANAGYGINLDVNFTGATVLNPSSNTIRLNTVTGNGVGAGTQLAGLAIVAAGTGNLIEQNIFANNAGDGILATAGITNIFSQNTFFGNVEQSIDLLNGTTSSSVTINDNLDTDTGANNLLNFPVFTQATISNGKLQVTGFVTAGAKVELYLANAGTGENFGEGGTFIASYVEGSASDPEKRYGDYDNTQGKEVNQNRFMFALDLSTVSAALRNAILTNGAKVTATATLANQGTSEFAGNTLISNGPLPVELTRFDVVAVNQDAQLNWQTAIEKNNDHFEVERSFDGRSFVQIGQVQGNGTTTSVHAYAYTDARIGQQHSGTVYYRLKQVDTDGKFRYTDTRTVAFSGRAVAGAVVLYPNPATTQSTLDLSSLPSGAYQVTLVDMAGRIIRTVSVQGGLTSNLDVRDLAEGTYTVLVRGQQTTHNLKLVKRN
ncbi:T9SS type A sorting domain-containing protein [Hymenobacter lutimineralis]|uniref:T9SS type A sorting domain-containing protein n=1 Tax=Hymenobacter lutimineralis TaxID=2606448 RepID=A0A5D6VC30_9BACT|nr:PA14 domain-containing protein [Hymenobacter lutimineralis]TYZ13561.1 T9SS type A sorting domain-containing protein [Hymenobacter lutimineralis]